MTRAMSSSYWLLRRLWASAGKIELLKVLAGIKHDTRHIAGRVNNIGECELATNAYSAITETVTNAYDAVIRDALAQNRFPVRPKTVVEALQVLAADEPKVHLYHQAGLGPRNRTITIIDQGCGMTESGMINGVLSFGSADKILDPLQHGNYGMGGATGYGQSSASLVIAKTRDDLYYFTVIYKEEPEDENFAESYVYIVQPDGHLFSFSTKDVGGHAAPGENDWQANRHNTPILPAHGTVRRMWGVDCDYWGYHKSSLFTAIPDKMFGSPGVLRLIGDENRGRLNRRRGRRWELEAVPIGGKLQNGAEMLYKRVGVPITLYEKREALGEVLISFWIVSSWGAEGKRKMTPVQSMLDGDERGPPMGILATINGQTHGRLRSTIPLRNAGVSNLTNLTIVQVELDRLPRAIRRRFASSDRNHLDETASRQLLEPAIADLLRHDVEVQELSRRLEPVVPPMAVDAELQRLSNEMMDDPLLGILAGVDSRGLQKMFVRARNGKSGGGEYTPQPFVPHDPPTSISITSRLIYTGRTTWFTIKTDAPDQYVDRFRWFFPSFVQAVPDSTPRLRRGNYRQQVTVVDGYKVGTRGTLTAVLALSDQLLTAETEIEVANDRPSKPNGSGDGPMKEVEVEGKNAFPNIKIIEIDGNADNEYSLLFGAVEEHEACVNWRLSADNALTVYVNKKNTLIEHAGTVLKARYTNSEADILLDDLKREMIRYYVTLAMMFCRADDFDASEATSQQYLSRVVQSHSITAVHKYTDSEYRRAVLMRAKSAVD